MFYFQIYYLENTSSLGTLLAPEAFPIDNSKHFLKIYILAANLGKRYKLQYCVYQYSSLHISPPEKGNQLFDASFY